MMVAGLDLIALPVMIFAALASTTFYFSASMSTHTARHSIVCTGGKQIQSH
jgi:hypothetical protein